ncbi:Hypp1756 [Branchiostoma lanceolatum]|uniref:Hypp1756 protein n=1 Tax=Branchiostoma lanceolatum TaxID=7740 RepID=A0A8J9ZMF6_BRALA|nr:Hypp1756 [Branchiostoma lanceolatum]
MSLGCWRDTPNRAIPSLEGTDLRLDGFFKNRDNAIDKCYQVALANDFPMFAVQNGGKCSGSADGLSTYNRYGPATTCAADGKGGRWVNEVYLITVLQKKETGSGQLPVCDPGSARETRVVFIADVSVGLAGWLTVLTGCRPDSAWSRWHMNAKET